MSRRNGSKANQPSVPAPRTVLTSPDTLRDDTLFVPFGSDPYENFLRETDLFARRQIIYSLWERCTATAAITASIAGELASSEIYIIPTETNPSATTLLLAKRYIDVINQAMNRPGGIVDFMTNFVSGYWASKTGAFIATPRDERGNIVGLSIINPMLPRPYFGWTPVNPMQPEGPQVPRLDPFTVPRISEYDTGMYLAEGIWYTDGGLVSRNYYALPWEAGHYWQACYNSLGYGAFQEGKPPAEYALPDIVSHIAINDYIRRTMLCTDDSQVILWENVDESRVITKGKQLKEVISRRKSGKKIDPSDEGVRLHVWAKDPDKKANVSAVNLRAFPQDFHPTDQLKYNAEMIALSIGVNPHRAAPDTQRERFGNAAQAAMLIADEPGLKAIKTVAQTFFTSVVMAGLPLRSEFQSMATAENYAIVMRDVQAAQVIAQAADGMTPEQKTNYLLRRGVLIPSDAGQPYIRTGDSTAIGNPDTPGTPMTFGYLSLRDAKGRSLTYERAAEIITRPRYPAIVHSSAKKADAQFDDCVGNILGLWESWITDDLPTVVDKAGLSRHGLVHEVDGITTEVLNAILKCAKSNGARSNDVRFRGLIDEMRMGFYNLMGSPELSHANVQPKNNLFDELWATAGKVLIGTASISTLQAIASTFTHDVARYLNSARCLVYFAQYAGTDVPLEWELGQTEQHCFMCPTFARTYKNFAELWSHTGGLLPGDIRLQCHGNCLCTLKAVTEGEQVVAGD